MNDSLRYRQVGHSCGCNSPMLLRLGFRLRHRGMNFANYLPSFVADKTQDSLYLDKRETVHEQTKHHDAGDEQQNDQPRR